MNKDERSSALDRRRDRIVQLVKQKKTVKEICDLLGLDPENEPKYAINKALEGTGLKASTGIPEKWKPVGLKPGNGAFRHRLKHALERLLDRHDQDYILVAELIGLTQKQQKKALLSESHDWTISQMQRLADGLGVTFEKLLSDAMIKDLQFTRTSQYGRNSNAREGILGDREALSRTSRQPSHAANGGARHAAATASGN